MEDDKLSTFVLEIQHIRTACDNAWKMTVPSLIRVKIEELKKLSEEIIVKAKDDDLAK